MSLTVLQKPLEPGAVPIKLLKVVTACFNGGTEGQVLNLARNMDLDRFALEFACLRSEGDLMKDYISLGMPLTEFRIRNLWSPQTMAQQLRLASFMKSRGIRIVHSYNFYSNVFAIPAAKLAGIPVVIASIRDRGVYLTQAQKHVQKWVCSLADRILVNADSIRDWLLEQGYDEQKISVIKNGIDLGLYARSGSDPEFRRELDLPETAPLVVMVSRLNPQKGIDDFIAAAALVKRRRPDTRFLVVGSKVLNRDGGFVEDTDYMNELAARAAEHRVDDILRFTGSRRDIPRILREAAVSVLPSYSEGLSNTLLESMAAGVPVVATDAGGNRELISHEQNGFLVPVHSPASLADAILRIIEQPTLAAAFGRESRRIARERHSLKRMTEDTEQVYLSELGYVQPATSGYEP